jgi:transcriptional regulator with XRE-family HTH domain
MKGMSQEELAGMLSVPVETIVAWEFGKSVPERPTIVNGLQRMLRLPDRTVDILLKQAGHAPLGAQEVNLTYLLEHSVPSSIAASALDHDRASVRLSPLLHGWQDVSDSAGLSELRTRLRDVETAGQAIREAVEKAPLPEPEGDTLSIREQLQNLEQTISGVLATSQRIVAPVILPPTEDLQVRLVAATSLVRLEEYRQEENKWFAVTGIFLGGILGVFVNWVTGGVMSAAAWVLVAAFAVMGGVAGYSTREYRKRAAPLWKRVLGEGSQEPEDEAHSEKRDRTSSEAGEP